MTKKIINISKKQGYCVKERFGNGYELYKNNELIDDLYFLDSDDDKIIFDSEDTNCIYVVKKNEIERCSQKFDVSYYSEKENDLSIFKEFNDHQNDILF